MTQSALSDLADLTSLYTPTSTEFDAARATPRSRREDNVA